MVYLPNNRVSLWRRIYFLWVKKNIKNLKFMVVWSNDKQSWEPKGNFSCVCERVFLSMCKKMNNKEVVIRFIISVKESATLNVWERIALMMGATQWDAVNTFFLSLLKKQHRKLSSGARRLNRVTECLFMINYSTTLFAWTRIIGRSREWSQFSKRKQQIAPGICSRDFQCFDFKWKCDHEMFIGERECSGHHLHRQFLS